MQVINIKTVRAALLLVSMHINAGASDSQTLSGATGLELSSGLDVVDSSELKAYLSESYSAELREGKWGSARIVRGRVVNYSLWDDVEYLRDIRINFENAAIQRLLEDVNKKVCESGLSVVGKTQANNDPTKEQGKRPGSGGPSLRWSCGSELTWRFVSLDDGLYAEVREIFQRYLGGLEHYEGPMGSRDVRVYVFEGAGLEPVAVSIEELRTEPMAWSGRRVCVEGVVVKVKPMASLVTGVHGIAVEDPQGKLRGVESGKRVRLVGNYVKRGAVDETGSICRITSVEILGASD